MNCLLIGKCSESSTKYHKHRSGTRVYEDAITRIEVGLVFTEVFSQASKWDSCLPRCYHTLRSGTHVYQGAIARIEVGLVFTNMLSHVSELDSFSPQCRYIHQKSDWCQRPPDTH